MLLYFVRLGKRILFRGAVGALFEWYWHAVFVQAWKADPMPIYVRRALRWVLAFCLWKGLTSRSYADLR